MISSKGQPLVPDRLEEIHPINIKVRCPVCLNNGTFEPVGVNDRHWKQEDKAEDGTIKGFTYAIGMRRCPNPDCHSPLFVVRRSDGLLQFYPPEVLDFDGTGLPDNIRSTLEEIVKCHASECYKAAAIMVRRILEELCEDKDAKGANLKARLGNLKDQIVVPADLIDAADELRILGNDAAHVSAHEYDDIGKDETEAAIDLAKELLKATYQYSTLLNRLRSFKKKDAG